MMNEEEYHKECIISAQPISSRPYTTVRKRFTVGRHRHITSIVTVLAFNFSHIRKIQDMLETP
jgi:hypothetical protein